MPGGYGTYHNGCAVGVFWDGIEVSADGSQARITNARIKIDRNQNIVDSSNKLTWSGGAITDGSDSNINVDGSGEKTVKSCSETWCDLSYTGTTSHAFDADFSGINYAGTTLTVDKNITYPQRLYNLPAAPAFVGVGYTGSLGNFTVNWVNGSTTDAPWQTLTLTRITVSSGATATFSIPSPGTATSYAQSGLDPTEQYYWAIAASNSRGSSVTVSSGTTPEPLHTLSMNYASRAIGEAVTFTIDKHGSSYNSRIRIDDQIAYATGAATSAVYTFSQAPWSAKMPTVTSKSFTVYLDTYTTGGVLIGSLTYSITVTVPNAEPYLPNGNAPTIAETISAISTAFTTGIYIQGYSVVRVTFSGTSGDSATIIKKELIVNSQTYDVTALGYVDIPVTWNTSPTAQSRVTDSRGIVSTSTTVIVKGYAYSKPVITTFKAERCNSSGVLANDGSYVKFTINVASTSVNNGVEKNKLNYTVQLAVNGVASGAALTSKATDTPLTYSETTEALGSGAYSTSASYSFIITVSDQLASSTTTRIVSIPTEIVPLSIGNNGIALGKVYDDPTKALDVVGDSEFNGAVSILGTLNVTGTLTLPANSITAAAIGTNLNGLYYTEAEITSLLATKQAAGSYAAASHSHPLSQVTFTEIPNAANLNTYTTQGFYNCNSNAYAAAGTNFPEACAGLLEVIAPDTTFVYQRYTIYQGFGNTVYSRTYYNGTWSGWSGLGSVVGSSYGSLSGQSYALANGGYEKNANGVLRCWVRCRVTPTANAVSGPIWTFPVAFIAVPAVNVTASTSATTVQNTSTQNESLTNVEISIYRTNNTDTYIMAQAQGFWK